MAMIHKAVGDPVESLTDETLLAVLILGLYERLKAKAVGSRLTLAHDAGAVALLKHRGKKLNTRSQAAITLTQAVHAQLVGHAFDTSTDSGEDLGDSLETLVDLPQNTSSRLTVISVHLVHLRRDADLILNGEASDTKIIELLNQATQLDQILTAWAISVPREWKFTATDNFELPKSVPRETFIYKDRVDVYEDLVVASIWNSYRVNRIRVLSIVCDCIDALPPLPTTLLKSRRELAYVTMQKLADDICASVPFFLGTKMCAGTDDKPSVEYPYTTSKPNKAHRRSAAGAGGYNLIEPFHEPLKSVLGISSLRAGQKEWILGQLARIGHLYSMEPSAISALSSA
ncbi:MAG: hypothetical protein HETSPECPRED_005502 [Heterodermia speciosa]|uniref:Uncharacterized protein n=1 Tax=Heterodermia speciosa TaxID=116794 RepID=A0A8H3FLM7_9LECA|nr:MAG: hypothetical protein HETSPECPRED_005502 [Heterodermia speciosa]